MAYGNIYNNGYNRGGNGGGYQQNGYNNGGYQKQQKPVQTAQEFINERLDIYLQFIDAITERGMDATEFKEMLGGWITSFQLQQRGK